MGFMIAGVTGMADHSPGARSLQRPQPPCGGVLPAPIRTWPPGSGPGRHVESERTLVQRGFGRLLRGVAMLVCVLVIPASAWAQASITGTVKDTSGAVLPGVTVEVASPVLIEKVRTAVTDGNGLYRVVDLRAGT